MVYVGGKTGTAVMCSSSVLLCQLVHQQKCFSHLYICLCFLLGVGGQVCGEIVSMFSVSVLSGRFSKYQRLWNLPFKSKCMCIALTFSSKSSVNIQWTEYMLRTMLHQLISVFPFYSLTKTVYMSVSMADVCSADI